ncbi:helix-turn-helix transcriptional regulator [Xenorhabdus sp. DI]|uniref:helix-turn-helix domain-containing protein n=1 Tax=Xenorhabdus doucetiae TaxID=351671 RepID=UPI0019895CC0|nr:MULTISPECIES: helix-turn-helix transcriptional regulator [unclassified Xenorhabdus]MBD2786643.1 helix-turn-helix transcriptional regulator [Xenorhabdus sp. 3]MBD2790358.1 helix-turn-helix transcriptional regulator [Xenorhabdus sp. DI]
MSTSKEEFSFLIGKRLREEREKSGESQQSIAKSFGLSTRTWGKYERGETVPDAAMLAMLSNEYGFDSNYIITGVRSVPSNISVEEQKLIENYRAMSEESRLNMQAVGSVFAQSSPDKRTSNGE